VGVGAGRGLDGQSCRAATSLTAQSAGSAPGVPVFRRPAAAGGPPGHPAHHPGGWPRADQVPARRHRVRHLLNRSGCCRGGRQTAGQAPAGVASGLNAAGAAAAPARSPGSAVPSAPGSPICGTAHGRTGRQRRSRPAEARARRWAGRTGKTGISPSEACSRTLALHAPSQPAVPVNTATSTDTAGGSGPQYNTSTCTYAWKTLKAWKGVSDLVIWRSRGWIL
jgi:hypothetical protein